MKNNSIWHEDSNKIKAKEKLINLKTDVLIIGGGITGLTTAYLLKDNNLKISLIDKGRLGYGITSFSTAKITYLQGIIYQTLTNNFNIHVAKEYCNSQREAMSLIQNIVIKNNILCDLQKVDSIIFTTKKENIKKIKREKQILKKWNIDCRDVADLNIQSGIKVSDSYVFNPLKYLKGLQKIVKNSVDIYEYVLAKNINYSNGLYKVYTSKGIIEAKKIVVACHYPFFLLPTLIPLKTYIKREYVSAGKVNDIKKISAINIDDNLHSIRYHNNYVIYGSNKQNLTSKTDYEKGYEKSKKQFEQYFNALPQYTWMNQDIVSNDSLPFIGSVRENLYIATAYNAWGMTNGTISAKIISDLIIYNDSPYKKLFSPKRNSILLTTKSIIGTFSYMKAYISSLYKKNNPFNIKIKGIVYGVYKDEKGYIHKIKLICPHMKCNLVFNKEEKTWDCPCHGSRFDIDGKIIEGPAKNNLKCQKIK